MMEIQRHRLLVKSLQHLSCHEEYYKNPQARQILVFLLQGIPVPEKGKYGMGLVFLPKDEKKQQDILSIMIEEIEREGLQREHSVMSR